MNEKEFLSKYESEIPIFQAWGDNVNNIILDSLKIKIGGVKQVEQFLKIPPKPRIKDFDSIISKAELISKGVEIDDAGIGKGVSFQ
jgi:hypothetical protein